MKSFTSRRFREMYVSLPDHVQLQAKRAYQLFQRNPSHPGLNFKKVDETNNIYSARVGLGYRVLGQLDGADIIWFWIGPHSEYSKLL
jgi:mRNA-degrading endonuclease RelE of RelBE toxin-antitoxin system